MCVVVEGRTMRAVGINVKERSVYMAECVGGGGRGKGRRKERKATKNAWQVAAG